MILNSYVHKDDFQTIYKDAITFFNNIGYGDLNNDALWKWSTILYSLYNLGLKDTDKVVDIGGGHSPLTKILSNKCQITNVDIGGNWFPIGANGEYVKSLGIKCKQENIIHANQDFFEWCKTVEDNSIDFMYDSCSVIHFDTNSKLSYNDGCHRAGIEIARILKPGGFFICASDILHPLYEDQKESKGEFLHLIDLITTYIRLKGINQYGGTNLTWDEELNYVLTVNTSLPYHVRLNNLYYPGIKEWKTFCHYEEYCHSTLTMGRFVLRKDEQ